MKETIEELFTGQFKFLAWFMLGIVLIYIPIMSVWYAKKNREMKQAMANEPPDGLKELQLGALKDMIYANKIEILVFVCLFLLISCGAFYCFFLPNMLMEKEQQESPLFIVIGASVVVTGIVMAIVYVRKLWNHQIELYDAGMIICKGSYRKVILYDEIKYIDWHEERGRKKGVVYYRNKIMSIYNKAGYCIAQADSLTFHLLKEKIDSLNL